MNIKEFQQLRDKVAEASKAVERAKGAFEASLEALREEYGAESLEAAIMLHKKMKSRVSRSERRAEEAYAAFMEKWNEYIGDTEED